LMKAKAKKSKPRQKSAIGGGLLLEDGSFWRGYSFGAKTTKVGECVFHTAHQGYQEILTDPSYCRQVLIFSSPQIGNQGFSSDDFESEKIWASGLVVRDYSEAPYHWRKQESLNDVLKTHNTPGLFGVDTRRLILHLRASGSLWGVLSTETDQPKKLQRFLNTRLSMEGLSLTQEVSTAKNYKWTEGSNSLLRSSIEDWSHGSGKRKCIVMDFGVKRQILRYLVDAGFQEVVVVPATTSAQEILALNPDVVLLSNGPGDPAAERSVVEEVKKLHGRIPLFGICLGHQILGLSLGVPTFKLKFGHHAANHPVFQKKSEKVEVTSQNHGFSLGESPAIPGVEWTHRNLNDQTIEGFRHRGLKIYGIQFHPEAGPGPLDSVDVFKKFQLGELM